MGLSTIQWCDYTENFWLGCSFARLPDGTFILECFNCYAKLLDDNRYSKTLDGGTKEHPITHWGDSAPRHRTSEANWKNPLVWNRKAARFPWKCPVCGVCITEEAYESDPALNCSNCQQAPMVPNRPKVFSLSLGDWLDDRVPIEWFADMLRVIHDTPHLDWLLLTKRPQNWQTRLEEAADYLSGETPIEWQDTLIWIDTWLGNPQMPPANVWIGVSAGADQAAALDIPARVHFLSCEPMLRPMDTTHAARFNWIIFGGESGSKARPCNFGWIRDGVKFCRANGIAPFVKQLGSHVIKPAYDDVPEHRVELRDSHGGEMQEWPLNIRVREFPTL